MSSAGSARRIQKRRRPTKMSLAHRHLLDLNSLPAVEASGNGDSPSINESVYSGAAGMVVAETPQLLDRAESNIGTNSIPIDVDEIDDDVMIYSSTRLLPRSRQQLTRTQPIVIIDDESETTAGPAGDGLDEHVNTLLSLGMFPRQHDRPRAPSNNLVFDTLDAPETNNILVTQALPEPAKEIRKEPKFNCPVCMNELVDASSTVCGHIFCQQCIKAAVKAQKKCPTCRRKLTTKNFHRVYLPTMD